MILICLGWYQDRKIKRMDMIHHFFTNANNKNYIFLRIHWIKKLNVLFECSVEEKTRKKMSSVVRESNQKRTQLGQSFLSCISNLIRIKAGLSEEI